MFLSRISIGIGIVNIISLITSLVSTMEGIILINSTIDSFIDIYFLLISIILSVTFIVIIARLKARKPANANIYKKLLRIHIAYVISYAAFWIGIIPAFYILLTGVTV